MNLQKIKPYIKEDEIQAKIKELGGKLNSIYEGEELYMICVLKGAVMFCTDLAKVLDMPVRMDFIRLSSYGSATVSSGKVNAVDISLPDLNGKNVLIVEDIVDTGLTAKFLTDYIKSKFNTKSLKFCSLLNKKAGRKNDFEADYYCFDVENEFLVGYGLDYDEKYRNLPYIGII